MNYKKIYNSLIQRGLNRESLTCYYEKHHIIPKCLGGNNDKTNIVKLTAREHFIAHWLLVRTYPNHSGIALAFYMMCKVKDKNQDRYIISKSSVAYQEAKELNSRFKKGCKRPNFSGKNHPLYGRRGVLHYYFGKSLTEEHRQNISIGKLGISATPETNKKISNTLSYGGCYKAKSVTCYMTGRKFSCARELAEFLELSYTSVRRWLNWATPINFKYSYD